MPGWCAGASARVNGREVAPARDGAGYLRVERQWARGDTVELDFTLSAHLVEAHPWIESTRGCVAIERGPLVYCIEQADQQNAAVPDVEIDAGAPLESAWAAERLDGVALIRASGWAVDTTAWKDRLYRPVSPAPAPRRRVELTAIPYYAWANREPGAMRVWIPRGPAAAAR